MSMLPRDLPARPEIALAARLQPARSIGGDLYDFVDGRRRASGSSSRTWPARASRRRCTWRSRRPCFARRIAGSANVADVASRMNRELSRDNERMTFVTAIVGCLDLASGRSRSWTPVTTRSCSSHRRARSRRPASPSASALGVVADYPYAESHVELAPGTTLVLYTDGATDARNASRRAIRQRSPRPRLRVSRQDGARRDREPRGGRGRTIRGGRAAGRRPDAACPAVQGHAGINLEL